MLLRLHYTKEHNTFRAYYLEELFCPWFDLRPYEVHADLGATDILLLSLPKNSNDIRFRDIAPQTFDSVGAIVVDNLQEPYFRDLEFLHPYKHKVLVLTAGHPHTSNELDLLVIPEWFWYFESLWYRSRDYHLYIRQQQTSSDKLFLLPMRRRRLNRDLIYQRLEPLLDRSIFSYVERGIELPGIPAEYREDQRWFNPDWYDDTCFSVVCEDADDARPICWSEKSCKPLAFFHPFLLVAQRGLLQLIRDYGFETFPEVFDESYDSLETLQQRVDSVAQQIYQLEADSFCAPEIAAKTDYNHARFFDEILVKQRITERLIDPMLDFLQARI